MAAIYGMIGSNSPCCRINKTPWYETDKEDICDNEINMPDYFRSRANMAADKRAGKVLTNKIHNGISNDFNIGCFEGAFTLHVQEGSQTYQVPLRRVAYGFQVPLKEELERLQRQQIIIPQGMDETSEWCNSL